MQKDHLLIVEDNPQVLASLKLLTQEMFDSVITLPHPRNILSICQSQPVDVILLDMNFSGSKYTGQEGLIWLDKIREGQPDISVVLITAYGEVDLAVEALKRGAQDFVTKPWNNHKLLDALVAAVRISHEKKATRLRKPDHQNVNTDVRDFPEIIGDSSEMKKIEKLVKKVADTDANVLIIGENGTGKELVAKQIHLLSQRKAKSMVSVDVGAIPESLFESELFGYEKGAFTDARESRIGKIAAANKSTLFLDEIANLPPGLQAKLLSVLQNRMVYPLGSSKPQQIDLRLITATNQNPEQLVLEGQFREDLLYRINTITIQLPALRHRGKDIILLAKHFLNYYATIYRRKKSNLSDLAEQALLNHYWPGNVRELQHCMERAVILSDQPTIEIEDLDLRRLGPDPGISTEMTLEEMEKKMIRAALDKSAGNMTEAARMLGVTRQTLYNKMKKE